MAIPHAKPGTVIDVRPLGGAIANTSTATLIKTDTLEVIRIVMPAGKDIPQHNVPGEITVQCLEGNVEFHIGAVKRGLTAGTLLYLEGADEHWRIPHFWSPSYLRTKLQHRNDRAFESCALCAR